MTTLATPRTETIFTATAKTPEELSQMAQRLEQIRVGTRDYIVDKRDLSMPEDQQPGAPELVLNMGEPVGHVRHGLMKHGFRQLAEKLSIPSQYAQRMAGGAPELMAQNANHWLADGGRKMVLIRTVDDMIRAILSDSYLPVDSYDLFFETLGIAEELGAIVDKAWLTEERFFIRIMHPDWREVLRKVDTREGADAHGWLPESDDFVAPGAIISNSEIGVGSVNVEAYMFRYACANGLTRKDAGFSRRHVGAKLAATPTGILSQETLRAEAKAVVSTVKDYVRAAMDRDRFKEWVGQLEDSQRAPLVGGAKVVDLVAAEHGLTDERKQRLLDNLITGGDLSLFGLVQAVTATGRQEEDYNDGIALERVGDTLLQSGASRPELVVVRR